MVFFLNKERFVYRNYILKFEFTRVKNDELKRHFNKM